LEPTLSEDEEKKTKMEGLFDSQLILNERKLIKREKDSK